MSYTGYLKLWEIHAPHHYIYVNAFSEEEALDKAKDFIRQTGIYSQIGEASLVGITATQKESYHFVVI